MNEPINEEKEIEFFEDSFGFGKWLK